MKYTNQIPTYDTLKGHDFTNNLKALLGCKTFQEMSDITGIPPSTFGTWNNKGRTSYELIIRLHLALKIPVKDLVQGYQLPEQHSTSPKIEESSSVYYAYTTGPESKAALVATTFVLKDGALEKKRTILLDNDILSDISSQGILALEETNRLLVIDRHITNAVSGRYLVDIDGLMSLNEIQRIPGKKLAIAFNNSTLEVKEGDVTIVGKVVAEINML